MGRKLSTLQLALLVSLGAHGALLAVRIVDPQGFNRIFEDTPLEVILVNSRSGEAPEKARAIAQASLAGGGEAQTGRATSPLPPSALVKAPENELAERAARQLERYRDDPDARFDLPLRIEGTDFQRRIWTALCEIPRGRTLTYGELARKLGCAGVESPRAVGQACGDNHLPIVIPCHRVVAASGVGGFAHSTGGYLLEAKRWLLMHESSTDAFALKP